MKLTAGQKTNLLDLIQLARIGAYQAGSYGANADKALLQKGLILEGYFIVKEENRWFKAGDKIPRMVISQLGWEVSKKNDLLGQDEVYPVDYDKMDAM